MPVRLNKNSIFYHCLLLSTSSVVLQLLGFGYRILLGRLAGAQAIAVYNLVMSAYNVVLSCTLTRRMERRGTAAALSLMQKRKPASEDSLPESGRHPGEGWVRRPNGDSLYWAGTLVDKDGERRMLIHLDEVRVVGRSKVVVERMGLVTLDFQITVPEHLQGNCLGIVITPQLHDGPYFEYSH